MSQWLDFDRRYGTDTDGEIPVEMLGHDPVVRSQAVSYEPTDPGAFRVMLEELPIRRSEYVFLDLGSGKGRVVLLAAAAGFGQVIGIEASPVLHRIATQNLTAWARSGGDTRAIRLYQQDAADLELPERPTVLYLFNPFRERTLAHVLLQVKHSVQRAPRDLWIVYYNPQLRCMLQSARYLARVAIGRGFQQGDYEVWRAQTDG